MVRCKLSQNKPSRNVVIRFKFHRGSMQTFVAPACLFCRSSSNSTVVRCKQRHKQRVHILAQSSNSTVVRCKHHPASKIATGIWSSNSTVVRCKQKRQFLARFLQNSFKFHRGSMQTFEDARALLHTKVVQIPPWFDANPAPAPASVLRHLVQIPPWFDANAAGGDCCVGAGASSNSTVVRCKLIRLHPSFRRGDVQIPPWFDANP